NPRSLSDRQRWEINRALVSGKSVIIAVQNYEWDYRPSGKGMSVTRRDEQPDVNPLLEQYGLGVSEDILMDANNVSLQVRSNDAIAALMGQGIAAKYPIHVLVNNESMDSETSITGRLSSIFYLWGTALNIDAEKLKQFGLEAKTLMESSDKAWTKPASQTLGGNVFDQPTDGLKKFPLMALVKGQFPDAFKDKERPAWPEPPQAPNQPPPPPKPEEAAATPVTPAPGQLILMGCSEMFKKNFLQQGNLDLFLNSVDAVTLGEDLVNVRGKKPVDRAITKPEDATRTFWKVVNYGLVSTIIAAIGILTAVLRRRGRNAYTMSYSEK
ncbi:MAG: transp aux protein, partial [Candidatus Hydrogenedentes bacterium]|nr:transp aux protein [Candidatus Hydrogenedentota bacterium]